jgi:uncharacterized RmlC-like cupin family protein
MWIHFRFGGGFLLLILAGSGSPALGQSSMVADRADTGVILRPAEGERVPPFQDGRTMLLKIGPTLTGSQELFIGTEEMPPGTAIPLHRHERHEEALFLHRGRSILDGMYTQHVQDSYAAHSA